MDFLKAQFYFIYKKHKNRKVKQKDEKKYTIQT